MAGVQYFIVVDGYGGDFGDYLINITEFTPCVLECPAGTVRSLLHRALRELERVLER